MQEEIEAEDKRLAEVAAAHARAKSLPHSRKKAPKALILRTPENAAARHALKVKLGLIAQYAPDEESEESESEDEESESEDEESEDEEVCLLC